MKAYFIGYPWPGQHGYRTLPLLQRRREMRDWINDQYYLGSTGVLLRQYSGTSVKVLEYYYQKYRHTPREVSQC